VVERVDGEMRERVTQREGEHGVGRAGALCYTRAVPLVYTASVAVRHHELDAWGRVHPAAHLRTVAEVAVEASSDAGFGPAWYDALGAHWIVRRTRARFLHPVGREAVCTVRTWVADFRRVRSRRCYEVRVGDRLVVDAESDWVLIDVATGRPRRIPAEVERTFDAPSGADSAPRPAWDDATPSGTPHRTRAAIRFTDLDSLAHVNNAAYLDVFTEAALEPAARAGWSVERFLARNVMPFVTDTDLEYLDPVVWGEALEVTTWMTPTPHGLELLQHLGAAGAHTPRVRARTRWEWRTSGGEAVPAPDDLARAFATPITA
jgi:acyl-CoA thioester hydrolase